MREMDIDVGIQMVGMNGQDKALPDARPPFAFSASPSTFLSYTCDDMDTVRVRPLRHCYWVVYFN